MSITSRFLKPDKAKSFKSSQPNPPAPTTKIRAYSRRSSLNYSNKKIPKENKTHKPKFYRKTIIASHVFVKIPQRMRWRNYFNAGFESRTHEIAGSEKKLVEVTWSARCNDGVSHFKNTKCYYLSLVWISGGCFVWKANKNIKSGRHKTLWNIRLSKCNVGGK